MADHLIDPRIDATATVVWKRLKDSDLATPVEQVILHNLAEVMKGQQRLTERLEKLSNAVEKLANSQKLSKNRRLSTKSANTSGAADNGHENDTGFVGSDAAKALRKLLQEHQEELSLLYDNFINVGNKKVYQTRHSNAAADAMAFVEKTITDLDKDFENSDNNERTTSELSTLLKHLKNDSALDLYAKLGKEKMAKVKAAKQGKAVDTGAIGDGKITEGAQPTRTTRKRHRPNLEAIQIKRPKVVTPSGAGSHDAEEDDDDDDIDEMYQGPEVEEEDDEEEELQDGEDDNHDSGDDEN